MFNVAAPSRQSPSIGMCVVTIVSDSTSKVMPSKSLSILQILETNSLRASGISLVTSKKSFNVLPLMLKVMTVSNILRSA